MWGYGLPADLKRVLPFKNDPRFVLALVDVKTDARGWIIGCLNQSVRAICLIAHTSNDSQTP